MIMIIIIDTRHVPGARHVSRRALAGGLRLAAGRRALQAEGRPDNKV